MAAKTTAYAAALLDWFFLKQAISGMADIPVSTPANVELSLHTASPGVGGSQTTNLVVYPQYAHLAVPRSAAGFVRTGTNVTTVDIELQWPKILVLSGTFTATHVGASIGGTLRYFAALTTPLACIAGTTPTIYPGDAVWSES